VRIPTLLFIYSYIGKKTNPRLNIFRIEEEKLDANARSVGNFFIKEIGENLRTIYPEVIDGIQGMGCMLGIRLKNASDIPRFSRNSAQSSSIQFVSTLHDLGVLTVPAGENIVRLLPPLNLQKNEMIKALNQIEQACKISMI
jgi:acetylornithine/N-succinyldiaminopimelate aminotransferase